MANIEAHTNPIAAAIFAHYEKLNAQEDPRSYLGASVIGNECARALWYQFRWVSQEKFSGRMLRLFERGQREEARFVADLRAIGAEVHDVDQTTGKQFGFACHGGHMRGHMDGCARGIIGGGNKWHVLEFKTHNEKSFAELQKKGVVKAKPTHYAQMLWYMGQTGMDRALYMAVNKNDDDLYCERVEFDPVEYERILGKGESIIFAETPPPKLRDDPKFYLCHMCGHKAVCHGTKMAPVSCRTCVHATPERDGDARWSCKLIRKDLALSRQRVGCRGHLPLPFLLTWATPIDAGKTWIEFQRKDKKEIRFAVRNEAEKQDDCLPSTNIIYTSREISALKDYQIIGDPQFEALHKAGEVVG